MATVLDWRSAAEHRDAIDGAVRALVEGKLAAVATETGYHLAAHILYPGAMAKLLKCLGPEKTTRAAVVVRSAAEAAGWIPSLGGFGRRLVQRALPGPVVFLARVQSGMGLLGGLPAPLYPMLCPDDMLAVCLPGHMTMAGLLRRIAGPLVVSPVPGPDGGMAAQPSEIPGAVVDHVDVIIDDDPCAFGKTASEIELSGDSFRIVREGAVTQAEIETWGCTSILFVCTGNTCRSPLAEVLFKKMLAERLGCGVAELTQHGFFVLSAGLAAMMGGSAAPEAVDIARELGADLTGHVTRPLTPELARHADHLIVMTHGHLFALLQRFPDTTPRLLGAAGIDIADPIGGDRAVYQECARQIKDHLELFLAEVASQ